MSGDENQPKSLSSLEVAGNSVQSEIPICPLSKLSDDFHHISNCIGHGGFADVYVAEHADHSGKVAVKLMKSHLIKKDPSLIVRYRKEINKHAQVLTSDKIVAIRGILPDDNERDMHGIVMEYMLYGSLWDFRVTSLKELPPWPITAQMIHDIIAGMKFLHARSPPIIHRDLKLKNVLVGEHFIVKISDLGLATTCQSVTASLSVGTYSHKPPEAFTTVQLRVTTKFDVYCFGMTLWEFLAGEHPYGENDRMMIEIHKRNNTPLPITDYCPEHTPTGFIQMMEDSWHETANERPEFKDLLTRCEKIIEENRLKDNLDEERLKLKKKLRGEDTVTTEQTHHAAGGGGDALEQVQRDVTQLDIGSDSPTGAHDDTPGASATPGNTSGITATPDDPKEAPATLRDTLETTSTPRNTPGATTTPGNIPGTTATPSNTLGTTATVPENPPNESPATCRSTLETTATPGNTSGMAESGTANVSNYHGPVTNYHGTVTNYQGPVTYYQGPVTYYQGPVTYFQGNVTQNLTRPENSTSETVPVMPTKPQLTRSEVVVSDKDILDIRIPADRMQTLAGALNMSDDFQNILHDYRFAEEQKYQLLLQWIKKNGRRAKKAVLAEALWRAGCCAAAKNLK